MAHDYFTGGGKGPSHAGCNGSNGHGSDGAGTSGPMQQTDPSAEPSDPGAQAAKKTYEPHPLFELDDGEPEHRDIALLSFRRRNAEGKLIPQPELIPARDVRSWADVARWWGGGHYRVIARNAHGHYAGQFPRGDEFYFIDGPVKPFTVREGIAATPAPAPSPPAQAAHAAPPAPAPAPIDPMQLVNELARELLPIRKELNELREARARAAAAAQPTGVEMLVAMYRQQREDRARADHAVAEARVKADGDAVRARADADRAVAEAKAGVDAEVAKATAGVDVRIAEIEAASESPNNMGAALEGGGAVGEESTFVSLMMKVWAMREAPGPGSGSEAADALNPRTDSVGKLIVADAMKSQPQSQQRTQPSAPAPPPPREEPRQRGPVEYALEVGGMEVIAPELTRRASGAVPLESRVAEAPGTAAPAPAPVAPAAPAAPAPPDPVAEVPEPRVGEASFARVAFAHVRVWSTLALAAERGSEERRALALLRSAEDRRAAEVLAALASPALRRGDAAGAFERPESAQRRDSAYPGSRAWRRRSPALVARSERPPRARCDAYSTWSLVETEAGAVAPLARWPDSEVALRASRTAGEHRRRTAGEHLASEAAAVLASGDAATATALPGRAIAVARGPEWPFEHRLHALAAAERERQAAAGAEQAGRLLAAPGPAAWRVARLGLDEASGRRVEERCRLLALRWLEPSRAHAAEGARRDAALALSTARERLLDDAELALPSLALREGVLERVPDARRGTGEARDIARAARAARPREDVEAVRRPLAAGNAEGAVRRVGEVARREPPGGERVEAVVEKKRRDAEAARLRASGRLFEARGHPLELAMAVMHRYAGADVRPPAIERLFAVFQGSGVRRARRAA